MGSYPEVSLADAATTAIVILVQPVVAAAAGWLLFSEALPLLQAMGAGLVLVGIVLAQRTTQPAVTRVATVSGPPSPGS